MSYVPAQEEELAYDGLGKTITPRAVQLKFHREDLMEASATSGL
jgi:hypothetical protein